MDKPITTAVIGTILGIAAGVLGMFILNPQGDETGDNNETAIVQPDASQDDHVSELERELQRLRDERDQFERTSNELANELAGKVDDTTEAKDLAGDLKKKLNELETSAAENARQKDARIDKLEGLLEGNGILEHLSDAEIAARIEKHNGAFETAFAGKDKKAAMQALWDLQKLGPKAYGDAIVAWRKMAEDFGLNPFGEGPGEMGLNMQEYVSLVSSFGLIEHSLTDPNAPRDFRIASLYGLPWWSNKDPSKRAELAGDVLMNSQGYESGVAIDALRDINDPSSARYLSDFLIANTDNPDARKKAIMALALKDDDDGWATIEALADTDPDPDVKAAAKQALDIKDPPVAGIFITIVIAEYQAALAGIQVGDIMTHYNGVRVRSLSDVNRAKEDVPEGETADVIVYRNGGAATLKVASGMIGINGVSVTPKNE